MLSLLVAMDKNNVIGHNNDMPWHLPKDLKFFKEKTTGNTIIMGRKTYDSIGRPLPNRKSIVLTRKNVSFPDGVEVINNVQAIYDMNNNEPNKEYFVIGGGEIFKEVLPHSDRMYITVINESFEGDVYFPEFDEDDWILTSKVKGDQDEKNPYEYYFLQYDRK